VQKRADFMTVVLRQVFRGAWESSQKESKLKRPPLTMIAVGGFGRREMNPFSDVDILFLHGPADASSSAQLHEAIEQVLYMLWDVGFDVGHSTHVIDEVMERANGDLKKKTALLEARYLCGDETLWQDFNKAFERQCVVGRETEYLDWRMADTKERHDKAGHTVFLQEPNVKTGCGGLRDYQNLLWMARFKRGFKNTAALQEAQYLTASERKQMEGAYDFLLRVRSELHYIQQRKGDVLTLQLQGRVANNFKYPQKTITRRIEALMRDYYKRAQALSLLTASLTSRFLGEKEKSKGRRWLFLPNRVVPAEKVDRFMLRDGLLELPDQNIFPADPLRLLRVFQIAQQRNADLSPDLQLRIRRRLHLINRSLIYQPAARNLILSIFSRKGEVGRICRRMHELGVLGRVFPEFAPLDCLVQHEFYHRYTADEHTLKCLEMLDKILDATEPPFSKYTTLFKKIEHEHLLYLALLLHDTGRAVNSRDHSEASAVNAVKVARRFQLSPKDLSTLVFLVDHHLTMIETATRRNLDEEETIVELARVVQTQERLDMLMLLTFADSQGTAGASNWTDWKESLIWLLYHRTSQALQGKKEFVLAEQRTLSELQQRVTEKLKKEVEPEEIEAHFRHLPSPYFHAMPEDLIVRHVRAVHEFFFRQIMGGEAVLCPVYQWVDRPEYGFSEVILVTWDRERVFAKITGCFAACGLSILSADIYTRGDNVRIDTYRVATTRWEAVTDSRDQDAFQKMLTRSFLEKIDLKEAIQAIQTRSHWESNGDEFPTRVTFDLKGSRDHTLLDLQTPDRPGLLYQAARAMLDAKMQVRFARITTEKGAALDTFYLVDENGHKVVDEAALTEVSRKLLKTLQA
jgi:[protein-PII] uridylyltransferase